MDLELTQRNATLSGQLLQNSVNDEHVGKFGGKIIQLVPHLTQAIQEAIHNAAGGEGVYIVEIGGIVGDCNFFIATQAHPEFRGRPTHPYPFLLASSYRDNLQALTKNK